MQGEVVHESSTEALVADYQEKAARANEARSKARQLAMASPQGFATPGLDDSDEYKEWQVAQDAATEAFWAIPEGHRPLPFWNV